MDGGGRPRALIPGEGVREGLVWQAKLNTHPRSWLGGRGVREAGQGLGGGCKGFGSGGVGGRGTGPRDGATCVAFLLKGSGKGWLGGRGGVQGLRLPGG